ncbi:hypothetical protein OSB04_030255 [Centaurea solstitialis]|uniref:Protein LATERAL ROOT PRIMORDIUM 1 n=1 Tax=Centaurea solstitialis TaxID=347529 RepID=A0AA38SQR4_9ASTR|nr:hypothetical protein OSB04_030255 [Centaurea solstitialis]
MVDALVTKEMHRLKKVVASSRNNRLQPSDSGAFADWVSSSRPSQNDLSLSFNAGAATAVGGSTGIWSSSVSATAARQINYGEMGMFVVAPSHHHHHLSDQTTNATAAVAASATATALGVGVIPLLTPTPCLTAAEDDVVFGNRGASSRVVNPTTGTNNNNSNNSIQFWQPQNYLRKPMVSEDGGFHGGGSGSTSGSTMTCQDCGNQAKKDCCHRRCRTCCKSRGFDSRGSCRPASRTSAHDVRDNWWRRWRCCGRFNGLHLRHQKASAQFYHGLPHFNFKNTPQRSFNSSSSHHHQDVGFMQSLPGQVRAPAVFKCVRVTAVEDGDDEYAYQACVSIGGHVFKGFLYDQGAETRDQTNIPNLSELHLGGGERRNVGGSLTSQPPPTVYGSSGGGLLG